MKNLIKKWLEITAEDILADDCYCCDDIVTQEDVNNALAEDVFELQTQISKKK